MVFLEPPCLMAETFQYLPLAPRLTSRSEKIQLHFPSVVSVQGAGAHAGGYERIMLVGETWHTPPGPTLNFRFRRPSSPGCTSAP